MDSKRSPGSTLKPLVVFSPAFELGIAQPGSILEDIDGYTSGHVPKNYSLRFYGLVTAREALTQSYNVSTDTLYKKVLQQTSMEDFLDKMKIPPPDGYYDTPSLAMGTNVMSVLQNVNSFATIANKGDFVEQYMIEKITTKDGDVIYEHEPEPVEVFSPQTAYLTYDILRDVLSRGTSQYVPTQLNNKNVDWIGKTGTSSDHIN